MDVEELINKKLEENYKRIDQIREEVKIIKQKDMSDLAQDYDKYYQYKYSYIDNILYIAFLRRKKILLYELRIEINTNNNLYKKIMLLIGHCINGGIKPKLFNILNKYRDNINEFENQLKKILDKLNILIAREIIKIDEEIEFLVEETNRKKIELEVKEKLYLDKNEINKMYIQSYKKEIEELNKINTILIFLLSTFSDCYIFADKQEEWKNFLETNFKDSYKFTFRLVYEIYIVINNKNHNEIISNRMMLKYIFNNYFIDSDKYIEMLNERFKVK